MFRDRRGSEQLTVKMETGTLPDAGRDCVNEVKRFG